ncbi:MAG: hypothetical protein LIO55_05125 [Oscillospiraceae bacterium]|nr:hypothetical protein [Oscillospiraceae bacterium]
MNTDKLYFTISEAARVSGLSQWEIRQLCKSGQLTLKPRRNSNSPYLILAANLERDIQRDA